MGTRGLIIIKHNKQIKVSQYCQFDMYYDGHGKHIAEILQKMLKDNVYDHFKQLVSNLKFVDDDYLQEKYQGKVETQFLRNTASDIFLLIIQVYKNLWKKINDNQLYWRMGLGTLL